MISKVVSANFFYHTCRYICNKPGAEVLKSEGLRDHSFKLMADDFETQKGLRPSKSQACFHAILSFYPGEKPSDDLMKEIVQKYLAELKIVNTQYAISKHTDKDHLHLHIVANMVNNDGKAINDSWIGLKGKKIAQRLTEDYKLIPALEKNLNLTNLEALSNSEAIKYEIYMAISENLPKCKTIEELENRLQTLGIETQYKYKGQTDEKQGVSFRKGNVCFKGSQVDRKFSLASLKKTLEFQRTQQILQLQNEIIQKILPDQKQTTTQRFQTKDLEESKKELETDPGKHLTKTIDLLLKSEQTHQEMMENNLQQSHRRKKKRYKSISR